MMQVTKSVWLPKLSKGYLKQSATVQMTMRATLGLETPKAGNGMTSAPGHGCVMVAALFTTTGAWCCFVESSKHTQSI